VLNDVDQSLRSLLQAAVPTNGGQPLVSFQPPTPEWAAELTDPVINLFLYDVREDLGGQTSDDADVRDSGGRVVGRQPPTRKYQLSYLVSAWTKDPEEEHSMLGAILASVPDEAAIPPEHLRGRLVDQGLPVRIKVGVPLTGANTWDLWSALGTPPRTAIEIVVTAPLVPVLRTDLAPPAEQMELGVNKGTPGSIAPVPREATPEGKTEDMPKSGRKKIDKDAPAPELEARPGKRWTTFRVREQAVPAPPAD